MGHRMGVLVVVLLVALNMYLVPKALLHGSGPSQTAVEQSSEEASPDSSPTPSEPTATPEPSPEGPLMLASAGDMVIRSTGGRCGRGAPTIERSDDGGASFDDLSLPRRVSQVLAVEALSPRRIALMALDADCNVVRYTSNDRGEAWRSASPEGHWSPSDEEQQVVSPAGPLAVPCDVIDLSTVKDDFVRVLCSSGEVLRTFDDETWSTAGEVDGARAIRFAVPDVGFALARRQDCRATVLRTVDEGTTWERLACLRGGPARAITGQDGRYVAQTGEVLHVSTDGGETWSRL